MELQIAIFIIELLGLIVGIQMRQYSINRSLSKRWLLVVDTVVVVLAAVATSTAIYIVLIVLGIL